MNGRIYYSPNGEITQVTFSTNEGGSYIEVPQEDAIGFLVGNKTASEWFVSRDRRLMAKNTHIEVVKGEPLKHGDFTLNVVVPASNDGIVVWLSSEHSIGFTASGTTHLIGSINDIDVLKVPLDLNALHAPKGFPVRDLDVLGMEFRLADRILHTGLKTAFTGQSLSEELSSRGESTRYDFTPVPIKWITTIPNHPCTILLSTPSGINLINHLGGSTVRSSQAMLFRSKGDIDEWYESAMIFNGTNIPWELDGDNIFITPTHHTLYGIEVPKPKYTPKGDSDIVLVRTKQGLIIRNTTDENPVIAISHKGTDRYVIAKDCAAVDLGERPLFRNIKCSMRVGGTDSWKVKGLDLVSGKITNIEQHPIKELDLYEYTSAMRSQNYHVMIIQRDNSTIIRSNVTVKGVRFGNHPPMNLERGGEILLEKEIAETSNIPYYDVCRYREDR